MGFLRRLKAKYHHKAERKYLRLTKRRQFNLTIAEEIIEAVKLLAIALEVPRCVIAEQCYWCYNWPNFMLSRLT